MIPCLKQNKLTMGSNSHLYSAFHGIMIPEDPTSSEDGSGLHSPVFPGSQSAYPSHHSGGPGGAGHDEGNCEFDCLHSVVHLYTVRLWCYTTSFTAMTLITQPFVLYHSPSVRLVSVYAPISKIARHNSHRSAHLPRWRFLAPFHPSNKLRLTSSLSIY